jgi:NADH-quinone oxidoreductase subunit F
MICNETRDVFSNLKKYEEKECPVDYCGSIMKIAMDESCGMCVMCREGTRQAYEIIKDITDGKCKSNDLELLIELAELIKENASCDMSKKAAEICLEMIIENEEEWDKHIYRKRCTNLVCKGAFTLYVDPDLCDGCGKCLEACPSAAISGGDGLIHVINTDICNKSMECMRVCPKEAVKKAGALKPKLPSQPVKVGAFGQSSEGGDDTGRSRRRRRGE